MSKRLQVIMDDEELAAIRAVAERSRLTVSEWVRRALAEARRQELRASTTEKLEAIHEAVRHEFPTADIGEMLEEITAGYEAIE